MRKVEELNILKALIIPSGTSNSEVKLLLYLTSISLSSVFSQILSFKGGKEFNNSLANEVSKKLSIIQCLKGISENEVFSFDLITLFESRLER